MCIIFDNCGSQTSYCSQDKRSGDMLQKISTLQNIPFKDVFTNSLLRDQRYWKLLSYKEKIGTHLFDPLQN